MCPEHHLLLVGGSTSPLHHHRNAPLEEGFCRGNRGTQGVAKEVFDLPPRIGPSRMLVLGRRKGEDSQEKTYAGAGDQQAQRGRGGNSREQHSCPGRPRDGSDRADLLPVAHRVRRSEDRPREAPEASGVGEQPSEESGGRPDAGQPDTERGVGGKLLSPSRRRQCVDHVKESLESRSGAPAGCWSSSIHTALRAEPRGRREGADPGDRGSGQSVRQVRLP